MKPSRPTIILTLCLALAVTHAMTPVDQVNYQAVLRDVDGLPEDGQFDMIFRFWDSVGGGNEILVDEQVAVTVVEGLFNVRLGSGNLTDGAGVLPNDPYTSLDEVFRDFGDVWVDVDISPAGAGTYETLSPRVRVLSAPYALNASHLDGLSADRFIDTTADSQTKAGDLYVNNLRITGAGVEMPSDGALLSQGPDVTLLRGGNQNNGILHLYGGDSSDDGSISLFGNGRIDFRSANGRFDFVNESSGAELARLQADGDLRIAGASLIDGNLMQFDSGPAIEDEGLKVTFAANAVGKDLLIQAGDSVEDGSIFINGVDGGGDIDYQADRHRFQAANGITRAEIDSLGNLQIDGDATIDDDAFVAGDADVTGRIDVGGGASFGGDVEVGDGTELAVGGIIANFTISGANMLLNLGNDGDDDTTVTGNLEVNGVKNFVQNHPHDDALSVIYTALEGDEVGTYTRGSARLTDGVVRVVLGETFAWTTNPQIGLTAHLTPRGRNAALYVESVSTSELVVRSDDPTDDGVSFDYVVNGLRIGYEAFDVVRPKRTEGFVPTHATFERRYAGREHHRRLSALERFGAMDGHAVGESAARAAVARELREGIGEMELSRLDPTTDAPSLSLPRSTSAAETAEPESSEIAPAGESPAEARSDVYARSFRPGAPGIASLIEIDGSATGGDVVALHPDLDGRTWPARREADPLLFGVVAGEPGVVLGSDGAGVPVATSGIVAVKVDAGYGAIRPGDLLTASPTEGHAMRTRDASLVGTILGKALEAHDSGTGTIRVLLTLR